MSKRLVNVVIASGAALSESVDMQSTQLVGIVMPATWTVANLTFRASLDGATFFDLYNDSNDEYTIPTSTSRAQVLNVPLAFPYLIIRSGTTGTPVNQGGARTIGLICTGDQR